MKLALYPILVLLAILTSSGCEKLKTEMLSLASPNPDCLLEGDQITNAPCFLRDTEGKFLSSEEYGGRKQALTSSTVQATTAITNSNSTPSVIESIEVTSDIPRSWSNSNAVLTLDRSRTQKNGTYNPDYISENIRSGVNIFGLIGSFTVIQKPVCSNINTATSTATVPGIDSPVDPAQRLCMAPKGVFIYSLPFNGRDRNCSTNGNTNTQSCFISQKSQALYSTNASTLPLSCDYGSTKSFYNQTYGAVDFGKLKSPTISSVVRNYCQVSNGHYFYPDAYGGRANVCAAIASPPCWLDIPQNQTRTISSAATSTDLCIEDQNDTALPAGSTSAGALPLSKNTVACMTAGPKRYIYTQAYDGRYRNCQTSGLGKCFSTSGNLTGGDLIFTNSENTTCRNTLNTCLNSCTSAKNSCSGVGNQNTCFVNYADCQQNCYTKDTALIKGYQTCMINACTATRNSCNNNCNALSGTAKTNCLNTCTANYNNCAVIESPKDGIWYLNANLKLLNPTTRALLIPAGQTKSGKIPMSQLLHPNSVKAGTNILGVTGSFGGQGVWSSGIHRDKSVSQLTLNQESVNYAGSSSTALPISVEGYSEDHKPYREIPSIMKDDEGSADLMNVIATPNRSAWGTTTCGTDPSLATIDAKINNCGVIFGSNATWDGAVNGNAGQGRWNLVVRRQSTSSNSMVEVWKDERTGLLWSSLISESTNWCKASGSSNNAGVASRFREDDPNEICDNSNYQSQSSSVVSACLEETGFTNVDSSFTIEGKAGLTMAAAPKVHWRIPTLYDYEVAEYNGIRFVLPDMGTQRSSSIVEWTGTVQSTNRAEAWTFNSTDGLIRSINRADSAGVRCIGR